MADITFDGINKVIEVDSGVTVIDVQTLYSWWKQWVVLSDNAKYLQAFRPVGGDSIGSSLAPMYFFLMNGWQVRPQEANHILTVSYNLYVDGGGNPYLPTIGSYQVLVQAKGTDTPVYQLTGGSVLTTEEHNQLMGLPSASDTATTTWANVVDSGYSAEEVLRLLNSAMAGKISGAGSGTVVIRDLADTKDRITATVDANGNRLSISRDVS